MTPVPWRCSLHGGHSAAFCEHATGDLEAMLASAVEKGMSTFGISEHAPRSEERHVYRSERDKGYDLAGLAAQFEAYAARSAALVDEWADRIEVLRGFEAEAIPHEGYAEIMLGLRARYGFEYMVGSLHYVEDIVIDGAPETYARAVEACGGTEGLAVRYYETLEALIRDLRPEVVGHFDLIAKNAAGFGPVDTPPAREAARAALEAARDEGAILDLNLAGWRKGLPHPYPAPWLVEMARDLDLPFCFGDDSHDVEQVGAGLDAGRDYLLGLGVTTITKLTRGDSGGIERRVVALEEGA